MRIPSRRLQLCGHDCGSLIVLLLSQFLEKELACYSIAVFASLKAATPIVYSLYEDTF